MQLYAQRQDIEINRILEGIHFIIFHLIIQSDDFTFNYVP